MPLIILDIICSVAAVAKSRDLTADISTFGFGNSQGLSVAGGSNGFSSAGRVVDSFPLVDCILDQDCFKICSELEVIEGGLIEICLSYCLIRIVLVTSKLNSTKLVV